MDIKLQKQAMTTLKTRADTQEAHASMTVKDLASQLEAASKLSSTGVYVMISKVVPIHDITYSPL